MHYWLIRLQIIQEHKNDHHCDRKTQRLEYVLTAQLSDWLCWTGWICNCYGVEFFLFQQLTLWRTNEWQPKQPIKSLHGETLTLWSILSVSFEERGGGVSLWLKKRCCYGTCKCNSKTRYQELLLNWALLVPFLKSESNHEKCKHWIISFLTLTLFYILF